MKLLVILSIACAVIAYVSIKTPERYLPPEKIKGAVTILQNPLHYGQSKGSVTATGFETLLFYLKKIVFPHPLLFYYGYNMIPVVGWKNVSPIASLLLHIILLILALAGIRNRNIFSFGIFFYLASISIFSNLFIPVNGIVAERFLYTASLGFSICLVIGIFKITRTNIYTPVFNYQKNYLPLVILSVVFVLYAFKTITRNSDWKDHLTLYSADIPYLENSARANVIYAGTLYGKLFADLQPNREISEGQMKNAEIIIKHYQQGLKIDSTFANAWNNLGIVYVLVYKLPEKGIYCFEKAIRSDSADYETYFNLGYAFFLKGDSVNAEKNYRKSLAINIQYPRAFLTLNDMLVSQNRFDEAMKLNHELAVANPTLDVPYINTGNIFLLQSDTANCIQNWERAFQLNPDNLNNCMNLAGIWQLKNNKEKSTFYSGQVDRIRSSNR